MSLGYNVGAAWVSSADRPARDAVLVYSVVLGVRLTERLGTFLELFGDRQTTGTATSTAIDGGLTWLVTDVVQVDVSVGRGLWGPTDEGLRRHGSQLSITAIRGRKVVLFVTRRAGAQELMGETPRRGPGLPCAPRTRPG